MDRTLVRKDTATLLTRYRIETGQAPLGDSLRVGLWVLEYSLGIADAEAIAKKVLRGYRGTSEAQLFADGLACFDAYIVDHISEQARRTVRRHHEAGDFVAIVTSATRYTTEPVARELGVEYFACSELEVDERGCLTGRHIDPLCYGKGKLARVQQIVSLSGAALSDAVFYSDSITDLPLLERVGTPVAINPDLRLARLARQRAWRVERW
jgi:HAD superfamily hydrolase (TIGR01490 family)